MPRLNWLQYPSLTILPRRFCTRSRPFVRIWSVARVRKKYDCFASKTTDELSESLFKELEILKIKWPCYPPQYVQFWCRSIQCNDLLPSSCDNLFQTVLSIHQCNPRLPSKSTYINTIKQMIFNSAVKVLNNLDGRIKYLSFKSFKTKVIINNHFGNIYKFPTGSYKWVIYVIYRLI